MKNSQTITKLMIKLLPVQILLASVSAVNNFVVGYFASNYVGINATGAVGLYLPFHMLIGSICTLLSGGLAVICGKYLGGNKTDRLQNLFSLSLLVTIIVSFFIMIALFSIKTFNLSYLFTSDPTLQVAFADYVFVQGFGIYPKIMLTQLQVLLSLENKKRTITIASFSHMFVNIVLNYIFVVLLELQESGLALAYVIGMWIIVIFELLQFINKTSLFKIQFHRINWNDSIQIVKIGLPLAASYLYQTIRGLIINALLEKELGSIGISAYMTANSILGFFWTIPTAMLAVSQLLISISVGEEDKNTLVLVMKNMFKYYLSIMFFIDILIFIFADNLTALYFHDKASLIFKLSSNGLRILPFCMPLSIICMHFTSYGQTMNKQKYINILAFLDGVFGVVVFSYLLISRFEINGIYIATIVSGLLTSLYIILYAWYNNRSYPNSAEKLMVIPSDFGVDGNNSIDISIENEKQLMTLSKSIQDFCLNNGIDSRRAYLASLAMEEMAGNVISHGFSKDNKKHAIDIRVAYKNDELILRIRDDCVNFDPIKRIESDQNDDITKNIGIKMIYKMVKDINYQNILGLNILTMKI